MQLRNILRSIFVAVIIGNGVAISAQEKAAPSQADYREDLKRLVASYEFKVSGKSDSKPKLLDDPIFSWTNPRRTSEGGALFLWTLGGRPLATMGIWKMSDSPNGYELQSFSTTPLTAESDRLSSWTTTAPGVVFASIDSEEEPNINPRIRLAQMRSIALKHFSATLDPDTPGSEELRLINSPIFRYVDMPTDVTDGAMFAFAQDTDPEVFLILEARKPIDKGSYWFFAMAPSTSHGVKGKYQGKVVLTTERVMVATTRDNGTYLLGNWNDRTLKK